MVTAPDRRPAVLCNVWVRVSVSTVATEPRSRASQVVSGTSGGSPSASRTSGSGWEARPSNRLTATMNGTSESFSK